MTHISPRSHPTVRPQQKPPADSSVAVGRPLQFGKLPKARLEQYQEALGEVERLSPYGHGDLARQYNTQFSPLLRDQFDRLCEQVQPADVRAMNCYEALGPIKESSDLLFEYYSMKALQAGVITPALIEQWRKGIIPKTKDMVRNNEDFRQALDDIHRDMDPGKVKAFQKMVAWEPSKSKDFLGLMAIKFALFKNRNPKYNPEKESKRLLVHKAHMLSELLPWYSPRRFQALLLGYGYTRFPSLPVEWLTSQLQTVVNSQVKKPVEYEDLMEQVYQKQYRLQMLDYTNPQLMFSVDRKVFLKNMEVLQEAAILKDVSLWHPSQYQKS